MLLFHPANAPATSISWVNEDLEEDFNKFLVVLLDDTFVYSKTQQQQFQQVWLVPEKLPQEKPYANFRNALSALGPYNTYVTIVVVMKLLLIDNGLWQFVISLFQKPKLKFDHFWDFIASTEYLLETVSKLPSFWLFSRPLIPLSGQVRYCDTQNFDKSHVLCPCSQTHRSKGTFLHHHSCFQVRYWCCHGAARRWADSSCTFLT